MNPELVNKISLAVSAKFSLVFNDVRLCIQQALSPTPSTPTTPSTPASTPTAVPSTARTVVEKKPVGEKKKCQYIIAGKDGERECGVGANYHFPDDDSVMYCKKHFDVEIKKRPTETTRPAAAATPAPKTTQSLLTTTSRSTPPVPSEPSRNVANVAPVVAKVVPVQKINLEPLVKHPGKFIDTNTRIVFDRKTKLAVGCLDGSGTIVDLENEQIRFLEAHNLGFKSVASLNDTTRNVKKINMNDILTSSTGDDDEDEEGTTAKDDVNDDDVNLNEDEEGEEEEEDEDEVEDEEEEEEEEDEGGDEDGDDEMVGDDE
jgi:hypothetical protein